jgi:hypothetical protein
MLHKEDIVTHILSTIDSQEAAIREQWNTPTEVKTRHAVIENLLPFEVCREAPRMPKGSTHSTLFVSESIPQLS